MVYVVDTEVVGTYFLPAHTKPLAKTHDRFVPISVGWNQRRPALHASSVISASVMDLRNSKECMLCGAGEFRYHSKVRTYESAQSIQNGTSYNKIHDGR